MQPESEDARQFQYDVALSFAGEDRALVESVARFLVDLDVSVFYDEFFTHELWGKVARWPRDSRAQAKIYPPLYL
jgi:hypothetical protein